MMFASLVQPGGLATADSLWLNVPSIYRPELPVLVRVEIRQDDGSVNREVWDAEVALTATPTGITLSTNRVVLLNGLGSALVTCSGGGDFSLTATLGELATTRTLTNLAGGPTTRVGGTLTGIATSWRGWVQVTNDLTVPAGHTLTIESGTLVTIDGVTSGTSAPDLIIHGTILCLGTEDQPVTITCSDGTRRWGQIRHDHALPSAYHHTTIMLGGRAPGEGHTGTGPAIRLSGSTVVFERCNVTDHADPSGMPGKIMQASDSDITFRDCLLARARMGPEIARTALWCTNTWIVEMRGPDDADGIYIHAQQPGQVALLAHCVLAAGDDDGLDTLDSDVTVEASVIRDWANPDEDAKGISVFNGSTTVQRSLIANCTDGLAAKSSGSLARVNLGQSTVAGLRRGVVAAYKDNATAGNIDFRATNSIIRAPDAVHSDFGPEKFTLGYCNASTNWPGIGNFTDEPRFLNTTTNFRLQQDSPCVDAGDPATPLDPDWTRADVGAYPNFQTPIAPVLSLVGTAPGEPIRFTVGPDLRWASEVQGSADFRDWATVAPLPLTNRPVEWRDLNAATSGWRFYRVRMGDAISPP